MNIIFPQFLVLKALDNNKRLKNKNKNKGVVAFTTVEAFNGVHESNCFFHSVSVINQLSRLQLVSCK